jgi:hypothetical protein
MEGLQQQHHAEASPNEQQGITPVASSSGKGGRPKSSVWKFFETERKRDDKSKREDVRCKCALSSILCQPHHCQTHVMTNVVISVCSFRCNLISDNRNGEKLL